MSLQQRNFADTARIIADAQNRLIKSDQRLDDVLTNSAKNGLPPIAIGPSQGHFLSILCQMVNAKSILEIGTLGGYSTLFFAETSPDVQVTSIEISPKHREIALENLRGQNNVNVILGAALDVLPGLAEKHIFDFVFIDAHWDEQKEYFDWAVKLVRPGGCIFVDNAVRQITESELNDPKRMALIDHVKGDARVHASLMTTCNTDRTGFELDGFLIAIKL